MPENKHETVLKGLQRRLHPGGRAVPYGAVHGQRLPNVPLVVTKSGFSFSMQASSFHYCEPRDSFGPWTHVELGRLSDEREVLLRYAEDVTRPLRTVYIRVPIELVARLVLDEGGFA